MHFALCSARSSGYALLAPLRPSSPRSAPQGKSGKSGESDGEGKEGGESDPQADMDARRVALLSGGPSVIMLLEGEEAIATWQELMGPTDPEQWGVDPDFPDLRSQFGTDAIRNAVSGSASPAHAYREIEFFFQQKSALEGFEDTHQEVAKKSEWVSLDLLLEFCFPDRDENGKWVQHPPSTGRLYVFGEYGPLGDDGNLHGGAHGSRTLSPTELKVMISDMIRDTILKVYMGERKAKELQPWEQEEVLAQADRRMKSVPNMSRDAVISLFEAARIPTNAQGLYSFHEMQAVIKKVRRTERDGQRETDREG